MIVSMCRFFKPQRLNCANLLVRIRSKPTELSSDFVTFLTIRYALVCIIGLTFMNETAFDIGDSRIRPREFYGHRTTFDTPADSQIDISDNSQRNQVSCIG